MYYYDPGPIVRVPIRGRVIQIEVERTTVRTITPIRVEQTNIRTRVRVGGLLCPDSRWVSAELSIFIISYKKKK